MWRVWQPHAELERQGHAVHWAPKEADTEAILTRIALHRYDILNLARVTWPATLLDAADSFIGSMHKAGLRVFFECDDDMFLHLAEHLTEDIDRERLERAQTAIHTVLRCDGVTVSTRRLKTVVEYATKGAVPVAVVPNFIDADWWHLIQKQARRIVPPVTIGWAGAKRNDADLDAMAEGWRRVADRYPAVRFVVQGWAPEVITAAVPADRLTVLPFIALEKYPAGLVNIDIGCCSVADTPFNACKSVIKALEYGLSGAAVVATSALYGQVIRHNDTGLIADTADAWTACLGHLVADAEHRRVLAGRLRRRVLAEHNLQASATKWLDAWSWLLEQAQGRRAA
jgi:glycosyltransferase involved in cell wall biosynthesis